MLQWYPINKYNAVEMKKMQVPKRLPVQQIRLVFLLYCTKILFVGKLQNEKYPPGLCPTYTHGIPAIEHNINFHNIFEANKLTLAGSLSLYHFR